MSQEMTTRWVRLTIVYSFCNSLELDAAATFWAIMKLFEFDEIREELAGDKIHSLTNIYSLLSHDMHFMFDTSMLWFE